MTARARDHLPTPEVGMWLWPDTRNIGGELLPCDDWDAAPFRLEGHHADVAVRVEVTGRKVRHVPGSIDARGVRVRITFVGDGRPDTTAGGWLFVR